MRCVPSSQSAPACLASVLLLAYALASSLASVCLASVLLLAPAFASCCVCTCVRFRLHLRPCPLALRPLVCFAAVASVWLPCVRLRCVRLAALRPFALRPFGCLASVCVASDLLLASALASCCVRLAPLRSFGCLRPVASWCMHLRPFALRPFCCLRLVASALASSCLLLVAYGFGCLGGARSKNQHCNQAPPLSVRFAGFLPLTTMRCVPSSQSAPACVDMHPFALRPIGCLRPHLHALASGCMHLRPVDG